MEKIKLCLDEVCYEKKPTNYEAGCLNVRIATKEKELTIEEIAYKVGVEGRTFTSAIFNGTKKCTGGFKEMRLFVLDFDTGIKFSEILSRCKKYSLGMAFAYKSFSYSESFERFRVVFMLDAIVDRTNIARWMLDMLHSIFPEADRAGRDICHMYYGGKGLLNSDYEYMDACNCSDAFSLLLLGKDKNRNYNRKMKQMSQKYEIGLIDNKNTLFGIDKLKNDANLLNDNYIYLRDSRNASIYRITTNNSDLGGGEASEAVTRRKSSKTYHKDYQSYILNNYSRCALLKDFVQECELDHAEKMHILYNLIHIEGGAKFFLDVIEKVSTNIYKWKSTVKFCQSKYARPQNCCGENYQCKYYNTCNSKNIIHSLEYRGKIRKKNEESVYSLSEAEQDFTIKFESAVRSKKQQVYVLKAQTAIGKTYTYCNYIKENTDKYFYIAVPTNKLKNEIVERMRSNGIDVVASISVEDIEFPSETIKNRILELYELGYAGEVKEEIEKLINQEYKYRKFDRDKFRKQLNDMLVFSEIIRNYEVRVVVTTHSQLMFMNPCIPDKYNIIVDEDILKTVFNSQKIICKQDIINLAESFEISQEERKKYEELLEYKCGIPKILDYTYPKIDLKLLHRLEISSAVGMLRKGNIIVRDENNDFLVMTPVKFQKKMIVLSATANKKIYERYFDACTFYQCKKAAYKGHIYQYCKYGLSRNQIKSIGKKQVMKCVKKITGKIQMITFKKYTKHMEDKPYIYFGNSAGYNNLRGKDLAVVGTYHINPIVYRMIYYCLTRKVCKDEPKNRIITHDNLELVYFTYSNVLMREIQLWYISSELEQCVGRARALREDCNVYVFSDFPVEQAEYIESDYLS